MSAVEIVRDIFWVGAVDWNLRSFHGHTYTTKMGTTYNAYLIMDEKVTLVDTVFAPFTGEMIERIKEVIPPHKIDYIIINHVETDHSGALPELIKLCPKAKVFGTARCKNGLYKNYYLGWKNPSTESLESRSEASLDNNFQGENQEFQIVKTGEELKTGRKTLSFIEAPMLHWPDSMFTYVQEDALLMPNDAFGQHYASGKRFDDEVNEAELMDEAAKYYGNILWPLSSMVVKKIEDIQKMGIPIKMIAPSHGMIWRKDPMKIVKAYLSWGKNETKKKVVVVYDTMWGSTEKMARHIVKGLIDSGVDVRVYNINVSDSTEIIKEMLDSKGFVIGSSTHDNDMLSKIAGFLEFLKGLKPKGRIGCAFGSYGWAGGAVKSIEDVLKKTGVEIVQEPLSVEYVPDKNEIKKCYEYGTNFAKKL